MPRSPRIDIPGLIYHVVSRGVKQLPLFHDDQDRQQFLRYVIQANDVFPFRLHAYCLMTNHFHLLIQTLEGSIAKTMQHIKRRFAVWFNRKYLHTGHAFQGRYHSIPVKEDVYFTTVARYIHLNPVRAGIVARPEDYPWSNYSHLIRGEPDPLVDTRFLLGYFGAEEERQREKYKHFVESAMTRPEPVTERILLRMRSWGQPPEAIQSETIKAGR
jgi:putative transposase